MAIIARGASDSDSRGVVTVTRDASDSDSRGVARGPGDGEEVVGTGDGEDIATVVLSLRLLKLSRILKLLNH